MKEDDEEDDEGDEAGGPEDSLAVLLRVLLALRGVGGLALLLLHRGAQLGEGLLGAEIREPLTRSRQ